MDLTLARKRALLQFAQRLLDLLLRIHHEGTVARDGLVQRFTGHQKKSRRRLVRAHFDAVAIIPDHELRRRDRKSTRLNSSHSQISYAVFCLKKKMKHS